MKRSIPESPLQTSTSSRTKWRRLSSRLLPSLIEVPPLRRPRDGGSAAAGVCTSLARTSRRARQRARARRHAGRRWADRCSRRRRPAGDRRGDHVEVLVVALDPVERRRRRKTPVVARDVADQTHSGTSACRAMISTVSKSAVNVAERAESASWWGLRGLDLAAPRTPARPAILAPLPRRPGHGRGGPAGRAGLSCPTRSRSCCTRRARSPCP